jgi:aminomethyltransferase
MAEVPLYSHHLALGAKLGPFGGWQMPIEYPTGTVAEHQAVRTAVGIFDVSHMGKVVISGTGAKDFVNQVLTNDLNRLSFGQAQYSMLCNETGGIVDDLIVYLVSDNEVRIVPNASNAAVVVEQLKAHASEDISVTDNHLLQGIVAVQGPQSIAVMDALGLGNDLSYMSFADMTWAGTAVAVCRTGYTGEIGFEIIAANDVVIALWEKLLEVGGAFGLVPCGLGARDTLRTEMGYVLHGQDISPDISPVQARTSWAVGWSKPEFVGRAALIAEKEHGPARIAWGLAALDRGIPRGHMIVMDAADAQIGETTSGTFSPTLGKGIALALLSPSVQLGDEVQVDVRGRRLRCEVVRPPFVDASVI